MPMLPYSSVGEIGTTLLQYLVIIGVVALGCLPSLEVSHFRTRLVDWPTDRLLVNIRYPNLISRSSV